MKSVVRLNEILAQNDTAVAVGTKHPDLIELYNPGRAAVSLAGFGHTDEADNPFKFTFPAATSTRLTSPLGFLANTPATE